MGISNTVSYYLVVYNMQRKFIHSPVHIQHPTHGGRGINRWIPILSPARLVLTRTKDMGWYAIPWVKNILIPLKEWPWIGGHTPLILTPTKSPVIIVAYMPFYWLVCFHQVPAWREITKLPPGQPAKFSARRWRRILISIRKSDCIIIPTIGENKPLKPWRLAENAKFGHLYYHGDVIVWVSLINGWPCFFIVLPNSIYKVPPQF